MDGPAEDVAEEHQEDCSRHEAIHQELGRSHILAYGAGGHGYDGGTYARRPLGGSEGGAPGYWVGGRGGGDGGHRFSSHLSMVVIGSPRI